MAKGQNIVVKNSSVVSGDKAERLHFRKQIEDFKASLQQVAGSEHGDRDAINEQGLSEFITGGAYTRVLRIPKDTAMVSELWKRDRLWIIIEGSVVVTTEEGRVELKAPYVGVAPFGTKAAVYAQEDTLWAAITGVEAEKGEDIKDELIAEDYSDLSYEWDLLEEGNK